MAAHDRDPCPYVILNDFGGAFAMGAIGGTIWHGIKGARNAPRVSAVAKPSGIMTGPKAGRPWISQSSFEDSSKNHA